MMEFCPKCGALLIQKKKNLGCPRCSYASKSSGKIRISEKINLEKKPEIAVIKKKTDVLPIVQAKCPECKHEEAYFWTVQTRAADEAETKFFKCTKCGHTRREYK